MRFVSRKSFVILLALLQSVVLPVSLARSSGSLRDSVIGAEIRRLESLYGGHLGVMAKDLRTGEVIRYNATDRFPTASVIKLPVMAAFFHLVDQKQIDPKMNVVLTDNDKKEGSGVLQFLSAGSSMALLDVVKLMIILSDNTGANLVLDRLAPTHEARMRVVNDFLLCRGLKNTRILNRLYSWQTKLQTPESIRYGIGVSTPEDMVTIMDGIYRKTLVDSTSCAAMIEILKQQYYGDNIPRLLPAEECAFLNVAHKAGEVEETKADVGLILSDRATIAMAVFVDKHPDHQEWSDNGGALLSAHVARAIWNHFTGSAAGYSRHVVANDVDWTRFPGGRWGIYRSSAAPFPHKGRINGFKGDDGTHYPPFPHYMDSSTVVFVPEGFHETEKGANLIIHFHGWQNDNVGVLERYLMPQAMIKEKTNALLVIAQGPYRANDSFGGKMEDEGGLRRLAEDVLATMKKEKVVVSERINRVTISAHSGGYRPAAFALHVGGLNDHISNVFLFDAFYAQHDYYREWLTTGTGILDAAYTEHLKDEHVKFETAVKPLVGERLRFTKAEVDHEEVVQTYLAEWLSRLGAEWKLK